MMSPDISCILYFTDLRQNVTCGLREWYGYYVMQYQVLPILL